MATSPALPAFSYAQAAKGLAPSTSASPIILHPSRRLSESKESKTPAGEPTGLELSSHQIQMKDDDSAQAAPGKAHQVDQGSNAASSNLVDKENIPPSKRGASSSEDTKLTVSETSSPSLGPLSSGSAKEDDTANETSENWEKHSQASASVEKAVQTPRSETSKEQENDWDTLPPSKPMAKEELKVAPLPVVNFWQARMEAQEAKAKALAAQRPQPVSNPAPKQKPANPESNRGQKEFGEDGKRKSQTRASNNSQREDGPPTRKPGDRAKLRDDGKVCKALLSLSY
jgi:la-related protein 1